MAVTAQLRLVASSLTFLRFKSVISSEELLPAEQMPDNLKEPYIYTGYRPIGRPWKYYFSSMLTLHNESMNVWTHTIGFFVLLLRLLYFFSEMNVLEDKVAWPVLGFAVSCLLTLILSAAAHLLHSRSTWHHFLFFLMDYMGVTFYSFGSGIISMFTCSSKWYHNALYGWFLPINVALSWFSFYACCLAKTYLSHDNNKRKFLMLAAVTLQGIFISMPVLTRFFECLMSTACSVESLNHITVVLLTFCLCAVIYGGNCPEVLLPGHFDIIGHGHQIFHVLSVVAMLLEVRTVDIEINVTGTAQDLQSNLIHICLAFIALFVLEMVTLSYYVHCIYFRRLSKKIERRDVQDSFVTEDKMDAQRVLSAEDPVVGIKKFI